MGNLWLKIKVWTKGIVIGVLLIYVIVFIVKNLDEQHTAKVWLSYNNNAETKSLTLALFSFLAGVISTILFRMVTGTLRQLRDIKERRLKERLQREHEETKAKVEELTARQMAAPTPVHVPPGDSHAGT